MSTDIVIAFAVYFSILLLIGYLSHKKQKTAADFIMGNRSLNYWVIALSAHASDMSSWLFMGFPAAIYVRGLSQAWIAIGLLMGMFLTWQFVAKKLRTLTEQYDSCTLSTFFERRFNDTSGTIRTVTALMSVIFLSCYLAAGLIGMGILFESVFGIDYYVGMTLATIVVITYTFSGGFITVAWTDLFQALFLLAMIIIVPSVAYMKLANGAQSIESSALAKQINLHIMPTVSKDSILTILFLVFGWGLGYFGQPHIITKFMGIRKAEELTKSKYVGMTWMVITLTAATFVGLVGIAYFHDQLAKPELVFVEMVKSLFHPLIGGFILCGIIAASISTMDSQILVCSSVLSEDFYKHIVRKNASPLELLRVTRGAVIVVALLALFIAFRKSATVMDSVSYAWSGLGASFGPLVLMSLYSKKANKYGAVAGIITGGLAAGTWEHINPYITDYTIMTMIPGFILSSLAIYSVSALTSCKKSVVEARN